MALTGLNMDWVLPMTVGVWPFVAGMGLGWYSAVSVAVGVWASDGTPGRATSDHAGGSAAPGP